MRRAAPAVKRNREPIAAVLDDELPVAGLVLEIASGTGEHGLYFARRWPAMLWQPSDPDPMARASIEAWRSDGPENLLPPLALDAARPDWPLDRSDAIVCINMTHISPPAATRGLFGGAGRLLGAGAPLVIYGPFLEDGVATAPSNLAFDQSLRAQDSLWGLRRVAWIDELAEEQGLARTRRVAMPANNLTLVYRRTPPTGA